MPYDMPAGATHENEAAYAGCGPFDEPDELDELTTLDCGCTGTIRNAEESGGQLVCEEHLEHPVQLPRFGPRTKYRTTSSDAELCFDCPPRDYPTNETRCSDCPLRARLAAQAPDFGSEAERAECISGLVNGLEELSK